MIEVLEGYGSGSSRCQQTEICALNPLTCIFLETEIQAKRKGARTRGLRIINARTHTAARVFGIDTGILGPEDEVVTGSRDIQRAETNLLQFLGLHAVRKLEILEAEEVTRLHITVADKRVVAGSHLGTDGTGYGSHLTILTPTVINGLALVAVAYHALGIEASQVDNLVT